MSILVIEMPVEVIQKDHRFVQIVFGESAANTYLQDAVTGLKIDGVVVTERLE